MKKRNIKKKKNPSRHFYKHKLFLPIIIFIPVFIITLLLFSLLKMNFNKSNTTITSNLYESPTPTEIKFIDNNSCINTHWGFGLDSPPPNWACKLSQPDIPPIDFKNTPEKNILNENQFLSVLNIINGQINISVGKFGHDQVCQPKSMYSNGDECNKYILQNNDRLFLQQHTTIGKQNSSRTIVGKFYSNENICASIHCQNILITYKENATRDLTTEELNEVLNILNSFKFYNLIN